MTVFNGKETGDDGQGRLEEWRSVVGYEGYEVSSCGRIRSYWKQGAKGRRVLEAIPHFLFPGKNPQGYVKVGLTYAYKKARLVSVHILVLEAFVGKRPNLLGQVETRHLNDVKDDNRIENLVWGTSKENQSDALRNGRRVVGEKKWNSKLTDESVIAIREMARNPPSGPKAPWVRELASKYSVDERTIYAVIRGSYWRHV